MKSQVNNSEMTNKVNLLFILSVLIFSGIISSVTPSSYTHNLPARHSEAAGDLDASEENSFDRGKYAATEIPAITFESPVSEVLAETKTTDKLLPAESSLFYAKMAELMEIEEEEALEIPTAAEIESWNSKFESAAFKPGSNKNLEQLVQQKNQDLAEFYEVYWKTKKYAEEVEKDVPLELENWMTDDGFWDVH